MTGNMIASDKVEMPPAARDKLMRQTKAILRMIDKGATPFKVIDRLNQLVDDGLRLLPWPERTCTRGCSHCCHVAVSLTALEANYIQARTGYRVESLEKREYDEASRAPCSFLKNGECAIYEHRPIACRIFLSFDDIQYCVDETATHKMLALSEPGNGGFEMANQLYHLLITHYLTRFPNYRVFNDVRTFFGSRAKK